MKTVLNQKQAQEMDYYAIEKMQIPQLTLMERAAQAVADEVRKMTRLQNSDKSINAMAEPPNNTMAKEKILIVVESGNNGGDGLAIARLLHKDYDVLVYYIHAISHTSAAFQTQYEKAQKLGIKIVEEKPLQDDFSIIIDGIFGVGLKREVQGIHKEVIAWMNTLSGKRIAIDIPSGIHATTAKVLGIAVTADQTVTFEKNKIGNMLYPGKAYAGKVVTYSIGIPEQAIAAVSPDVFCFEPECPDCEAMSFYPKRNAYSHKGTYGSVLLIAGSAGMAGAACMAGLAAYRMGCGLVRILTHESNRMIVQMALPEAVVLSYQTTQEACHLLEENWEHSDAVMIGSGLSLSETAKALTKTAITYIHERKIKMPVVVDADSLTILAKQAEILQTYAQLDKKTRSQLIFTPHVKEMSRLVGKDITHLEDNLITIADNYIHNWQLEQDMIVVLKDARCIVTDASHKAYINITGNAGMATAGSGDVLAGIIVSLLAQNNRIHKEEVFLMVCCAVCKHGAAGDKAKEKVGMTAMMARDIIDGLVASMIS